MRGGGGSLDVARHRRRASWCTCSRIALPMRNHTLSPRGLAALTLAQEYGFHVFPVYEPREHGCSCARGTHCDRIGKHPRLSEGFKGATMHAEQVGAWWDRWPDANIGLYPGGCGLIVFDVDGPEGEAHARALGVLDLPTLTAHTARGEHWYYRLPVGCIVGNVARAELDIRAHAGYVLAPPSLHSSGHVYTWSGAPDTIAELPGHVLDALAPRPAGVGPRRPPTGERKLARLDAPDERRERRILAYVRRLGFGLADGRKRAAFQLAAFLLHDVTLSQAATFAYATRWDEYNVPPLGARLIEQCCTNAARYGGRRVAA